jgi:hypothetical protein
MKASLLLFSLFFLFSCATNPYRPYKGNTGYSEIQTGQDTYEIQFHGSSKQDELKAREYAIVRAAEIAKNEGSPNFKIDSAKTREKQELYSYYSPDYYPYWGYNSYPYGYHGYRYGYYYGWYGGGYSYVETRPVVRITVSMESGPCEGCLSTNQEIREAQASGILQDHAG